MFHFKLETSFRNSLCVWGNVLSKRFGRSFKAAINAASLDTSVCPLVSLSLPFLDSGE